MSEYNETNAVMQYASFRKGILTASEEVAYKIHFARNNGSPSYSDRVERHYRKWGNADDQLVQEYLDLDREAFEQRVVARILRAEGRGDLNLNRCHKCQRIVRTPLAKQCLWCGHDWH